MTPAGRFEFSAAPDELGERVDLVVARRAGVARAAARAAVRAGAVTVSGTPVRPSHRLRRGDVVAGSVDSAEKAPPGPEAIPLVVRYSDERVLVVSKPPGLVVHPGAGHASGTLVNALMALGTPLAAAGTARPGIVHRLDKDTSGLLLVAKDDAAHAALVEALRARAVERSYLALVAGKMQAPSGTIDAPVGRHPTKPRMRAVTPSGKPATTRYRVVRATGEVSLLEVALDTGRTHQIRVHLAYIGHPVVGDRTYGSAADIARRLGLERPFLHAWRLAWPDPAGGGRREIGDDLPADLAAALERAGLSLPLQGRDPEPRTPPERTGPRDPTRT